MHIQNTEKTLEMQGMYNVTTYAAFGVLFLHGFVALTLWLEAALLLRCACVLAFVCFLHTHNSNFHQRSVLMLLSSKYIKPI